MLGRGKEKEKVVFRVLGGYWGVVWGVWGLGGFGGGGVFPFGGFIGFSLLGVERPVFGFFWGGLWSLNLKLSVRRNFKEDPKFEIPVESGTVKQVPFLGGDL